MVQVRAEFLGKPNHSRLASLAQIRGFCTAVMTPQVLGNSGAGVDVPSFCALQNLRPFSVRLEGQVFGIMNAV